MEPTFQLGEDQKTGEAKSMHGVELQKGLTRLAEFATGCVLMYSAYMHILFPMNFFESLLSYRLSSFRVTLLMSWLVPQLMFLLGVGSVIGRLGSIGRWFVLLLFSVFSLAQLTAILRGLDIDCGCWGPKSDRIGVLSIAFVLTLTFVQGIIIKLGTNNS